MTPWEADVAVAMSEAQAGRGNPDIARVLAAEVAELRRKLIDKLAADLRRCPRCGELADSVETRIDGPTRYRHGQLEHLDLTTDLKAVRHGG
jgi:hypothetical protein